MYYVCAYPVSANGRYQSSLKNQVVSAETKAFLYLKDIPETSIINIKENGVSVSFYIAKHDYEEGLNGAGRNLMIRKDSHSTRPMNSAEASRNDFAQMDLHTWLNGEYKSMLSETVQSIIGETAYPYTPGTNSSATSRKDSVFLLSGTEFIDSTLIASNGYVEGTLLPNASIYKDGKSVWTRTPLRTQNRFFIWNSNMLGYGTTTQTGGVFPVFTLPNDTKIESEQNPNGSFTLIE